MTPQFVQELTGSSTGQGAAGTPVWAYLWVNKPPADVAVSSVFTSGPYADPGATNNTTPLIIEGSLTPNVTLGADGNYNVQVTLTDTAYQYVTGGAVYLLVQSEPLAGHTDLPSSIGNNVGNIQPNSAAWHFGYSSFEYSLQGLGSDQGDLTAIDGLGPNLGVQITYTGGGTESRGSKLTGEQLLNGYTSPLPAFDGLISLNSAANHTYSAPAVPPGTPPTGNPVSPLNGDTSFFVSPSNGYFNKTATPLWSTSVWDTLPDGTGTGYLTAFAALTDIKLSGVSNGEPDANGIWHNAQYYEYTVSAVTLAANTGTNGWGAAGTYFLFSPTAASQTKGYMLISESTLQENLYAAGQGTATMWSSWDSATPANSVAYIIPGSGQPPGTVATDNTFNPSANNQYGTVFTNLFTGFTAGYWGSTANQANPFNQGTAGPSNLAAGTVNLDDSRNWASAYAFDGNRDTTLSPTPSFQHYDPYSKVFFENTNVYGSAFSDNLSSGLTPGPLIPLSQPGSTGTNPSNNVGNIDLYVYASTETGNYTAPLGANYLPVPAGSDYLIPTQTSGLSLQVTGQAAGMLVREDVTLKLGIYSGKDGNGHGTFEYVTVQTNGNLWQTFTVSGSPGSWSAVVDPTTPTGVGTFVIDNLPAPATPAVGDIYWYQLVFSDTTGDQKVYDFYATAASTTPGDILTTDASVAADGGATFPPGDVTSSQIQLALNPASSMPSGLLDFVYNSQFAPMPAAPIAGTLTGSVFTAIDGQNGTGIIDPISNTTVMPGILIASASATLAFGWTAFNNGTHTGTATGSTTSGLPTSGLISNYTNKINAGDVAQISVLNAATGTVLPTVLSGTADLDGQWQTWGGTGASTITLATGIYTATMMEMMPDGTTPFGSATGTQSAPLYILVSSTSSFVDTAAHISNALLALQTVENQVTSPFPVTVSDNGLIAMNFAGIATYATLLSHTTNANSTPYELAITDSSTTIVANIAALNSNTHVETIAFSDPDIPTLTFTETEYDTTYSTAISEFVGERTIVVSNVTGEVYNSYELDYRHGVLSTGANGSGVLQLTRQFASGYTGTGPITSATVWEHDLDSANRAVRDLYTNAVFSALPAPYPVAAAQGATYGSAGPTNLTFTSVEYDYANGSTNPVQSIYSYATVSGPPGSVAEVDVFDVNNNQLSQMFSGFNPSTSNGKAATETFFETVNNVLTVVGTGTIYQYSTPPAGTNYTGLVEEWDTSQTPQLVKQVFSGLSGPESAYFSSYEYDYLQGALSGSKYVLAPVTGQLYTGGEIHLDVNGNLSRIVASGITSQAYSSYEYDYIYDNGAYAGGAVIGQKYFYTNIEGLPYTAREVDVDAAGQTTKIVQSGYTVSAGQPYSSVEYDYAGGSLIGSKYYITNIAGQNHTGEQHDFNASGQVVAYLFTGVTTQAYTSYEYDYTYDNGAWGGGAVVGQTYTYTGIQGQTYLSYETELDASNAIASITYSGYTTTDTQPYSSLEYEYAGGAQTGAYSGYITNIAGQNHTGEQHDFNTSGQLIRQLFTGVTGQPYASYEYDYSDSGANIGSKYYYTNVVNHEYSSYEYDLTPGEALALEIYNMNDGSHRIIGSDINQTINSIYNDLTTGGGGADTFAYTPFFGQATITDFTAADTISLPTSEFASYDYLQSHNGLVGGNLMLTGSNGDTLTLQGVNALPGPSKFEFSS